MENKEEKYIEEINNNLRVSLRDENFLEKISLILLKNIKPESEIKKNLEELSQIYMSLRNIFSITDENYSFGNFPTDLIKIPL